MTYLKIQTLTPLHIGSGKMLQGNFEYLYFANEGKISVIDDKKILDIIGSENIDKWVSIINNEEDLLDYLKKRKPNVSAEDTQKRMMTIEGRVPQKTKTPEGKDKFPEIREFLYSGNQKPMLPASSLKGSIRTAFLTNKIYEDKENASKENKKIFASLKSNITQEKFGKISYSDKRLNNKFIGADPNHDIFRFLQISDVYFDETVCMLSETLNEKGNGLEIKDSIKQFVEAIPEGSLTTGEIKISNHIHLVKNEMDKTMIQLKKEMPQKQTEVNNLKEQVKRNNQNIGLKKKLEFAEKDLKSLNTYIDTITLLTQNTQNFDLKSLFYLINAHTKNSIEKEIAIYEDKNLPKNASELIENFKELVEQITQIEKKQENACILRVGFGSGFKSMTGDWQEDLLSETDLQDLADKVRGSKYHGLAFPKSRKLILGDKPMGFLKLTLIFEKDLVEIESEKQELKVEKQKQQQKKQEALILAQQKAEEKRLAEEAEAQRIAEEARKPQMKTVDKLKLGEIVDAIVLRMEGKQVVYQIFVEGYENKEFKTSYPAGFEKDTIITVKINDFDKQKKIIRNLTEPKKK